MAERRLLASPALRWLLPALVVLTLAVFWKPEREVLWSGSWVLKQCLEARPGAGANCIGQYEISIANTGTQTENLTMEWQLGLSDWSIDGKVLNLSADFKRANDPGYICDQVAENAACSIENFAPGTLLIITLRCLACEWSELESVDRQSPAIVSKAKVYRSDPRSTYLLRRLGFFLSFLA